MRKVRNFSLVIFALLITGGLTVDAQDRNSITGFVFDESRRPLEQVYVELQDDFYSTVSRVRTRGSGMFAFAGLPAGNYNVKVLNAGTEFEEQSRFISLIPLSAMRGSGTATEQVDFYLRRKKLRTGPTAPPGVIFVQEVPAAAKALFEAGETDLSNKNDVAGLDKIKRSIEIFPDYFSALDRLGNEYVARGYYEPARLLLTQALKVNPQSFASTLAFGVAEFRLGRNDQALDRFKQAVALEKGSANAHLWLGISLHGKGDLKQSLAALLEANKLSGETVAEVHFQLARVYKDQKKYTNAANELEQFLKYRPDAENSKEIKQVIVSLRQKK